MSPGYRVVTAPRAPIVLVLILAALLCLPPQMHDLIVWADGYLARAIVFQASLASMAFLAWFWSRTALNFAVRCSDSAPRAQALQGLSGGLRLYFSVCPRALFFVTAGAGFWVALNSGAIGQALATAAWAVAGTLLLLFRKRFNGISITRPLDPRRLASIEAAVPFGLVVTARVILAAGVLAFLASAIETSTAPRGIHYADWIAELCPGPAAAMFAFALILGPTTWLTMLADGPVAVPWRQRSFAAPVMFVLGGLIALSLSLTVHPIRIARSPDNVWQSRVPLAAVLGSWVSACGGGSGAVTPIVVALSGGASRAGAWGARVLRAVDTVAPGSGSGIFAISSVSGGSLGAADYLVRRANAASTSPCHLPDWQDARQPAPAASLAEDQSTRDRFENDLLGPLLANAILMDPVRALLAWPLHWVWPGWPPRATDRAGGLERAFERAWSRPHADAPQLDLATPFLSLFYDRPGSWRTGMPLWISNGTEVNGGERLVTVAVAPAPDQLLATWPFEGAKDVLSLLDADVPVSTAVHNSARFPFLSPTGSLVPRGKPPNPRPAVNRPSIADGGYFENSGVTTAFELTEWMHHYGPALIGKPTLAIDPILVVVDADAEPSMLGSDVPRCGSGPSRDPTQDNTNKPSSQIIAPLVALYSVRSGHAEYAIEKAIEAFCNVHVNGLEPLPDGGPPPPKPPPSMFNFYLHADAAHPIPLNWVLSHDVVEQIWGGMTCDNADELADLQDRIDPDAPSKVQRAVVPACPAKKAPARDP